VFELTLSQTVSGKTSATVQGWVDTRMERINFGNSKTAKSFTHVMYVLPNSVNFGGAAAYAYVGYGQSVYWDSYASTLLVLVHETGHNLR